MMQMLLTRLLACYLFARLVNSQISITCQLRLRYKKRRVRESLYQTHCPESPELRSRLPPGSPSPYQEVECWYTYYQDTEISPRSNQMLNGATSTGAAIMANSAKWFTATVMVLFSVFTVGGSNTHCSRCHSVIGDNQVIFSEPLHDQAGVMM